ncbi:MAG: hypothetical protein CMH12_25280 [Maritimibacter sp.]|nr:hypothetical protein [Maritimibacter sp.]
MTGASFNGTYSGDETACRFVSNFGLLKGIAARGVPRPGRMPVLPRDILSRHRPGDAIYLQPELLDRFAARVLPRVTGAFTLVTGNSVADIRPGQIRKEVLEAVLYHPGFRHWHAQNLAMDHARMSVVPLGLDYHTLSVGRKPGWGPPATPSVQEAELDAIRLAGRPLAQRALTGYSNWQFVTGNSAREAMKARLDPATLHWQTAPLPRAETWRATTEHFFTLSPRGRGMDCHRTWEALILGSVPVVEDLPIRDLFTDLPVVRLTDWSELTPDRMEAERERILRGRFDFAPLFLDTWRARIAGLPVPSLWMTYQQFLDAPLSEMADRLQATQRQHMPR